MDLFNTLANAINPNTAKIDLSNIYRAAYNANAGTSFSPEKRAEQTVNEYTAMLTEDIEGVGAATEEVKAQYIERFKKYLLHYLAAKSRCISPMIAGPSNFPVRQQQKYHSWEDSAYNRFKEWREKALKAISREIEKNRTPEDKNNEIWLKTKARILDAARTINEIDTGINNYSARPLFVSVIVKNIETHAKNGRTDIVNKAIDLLHEINTTAAKPIITARHKVFTMLDEAEKTREKIVDTQLQENKIIHFDGGNVVFNYSLNRLQIKHDQKPQQETIQLLKSNGFKWSPREIAWQRFLTNESKYKASQILKIEIK